MKIIPYEVNGSHRTGHLNITLAELTELIGFEPNQDDDGDKVENSWGFLVHMPNGDIHECAVWDYKGSHHFDTFSTYGPSEALKAIFGDKYVGENWRMV